MKYFVELNGDDVAKIIAEKFGVSVSDVSVNTVRETVGYGPMERDVHVVQVTVEKANDQ